MNTDIDFSMIPPLEIILTPSLKNNLFSSAVEFFSWAIVTSNDTKEIREIKNLITIPQNQHNCGCCYAMTVATCINDVFVVSGLKWNPEISTTYLMQNFNTLNGNLVQNKCQGGNPGILLSAIEKSNGVASNRCVDYSWCISNNICVKNENKELQGSKLRDYLNTLITPKGCFFVNRNTRPFGPGPKGIQGIEPIIRNVYKIKNVRTVKYKDNSYPEMISDILKKIIFENGPIIMSFFVHSNFNSTFGDYSKLNGIYFYNGNYNHSEKEKFYKKRPLPNNKHAVVIVGWGITYVDIDNNGNKKNIPYWHCRNTFGPEWGDKGYFKFAMYPYNKEIIEVGNLGGFLTFSAFNITTQQFPKTTEIPTSFIQNKEYYLQNDPVYTNNNKINNKDGIGIIKIVIIGFFLLFFFNLSFYKKQPYF